MTRTRLAVAIVWLAFVLRGAYYCAQLPLWEGFDEWAHYAALQYFADHGRMAPRTEQVSDAVARSLELAPLPPSNDGWVAGAVNHDDYWRLPDAERARRLDELRRITADYRRPPGPPASPALQYEAQQAPLYYAVMALPFRLTRGWPIQRQVLWLRLCGIFLASAAIPLAWCIARRIAPARTAAIVVAALLAAMPAVPLFFAHVGNDVLAFPLLTLTLWTLVCARPNWWLAGLALAAALLTKGYALVVLPVFLLAALRDRRIFAALALALALSGWWYAGNLATTGSLTGDQLSRNSANAGGTLAAMPRVDWERVADSAMVNHIWIGGWSFLQVRSWMYRFWEALALAALAGLLRLARRLDRRAALLLAAQTLFALATAWFAINTYLTTAISTGIGWYALTLFACESTLLAAGFAGLFGLARARLAMAATVFAALAFDLYTVHFVLAPYYAGLIRHRANGSLEAYHWAGLPTVPALWVPYLAANLALALVAVHSVRPQARRMPLRTT